MKHHGVADALDAGGGHDALPLNGHSLRTAAPQCVHNGLDVLLVHDERIVVDARRLHFKWGIIQRNAYAGATDGHGRGIEPGLIHGLGQPSATLHTGGQLVHFYTQGICALTEFLVQLGLCGHKLPHTRRPVRAQIGAPGVDGAHRDHEPRKDADPDREQTSAQRS